MNSERIKEIIYITLSIILAIIAVRFVIWLLPVILIAIIGYIIYIKFKDNSQKMNKREDINKDKNIKVIHDFDDDK